jgi:hypothetical protein
MRERIRHDEAIEERERENAAVQQQQKKKLLPRASWVLVREINAFIRRIVGETSSH